MSTWRRIVVCAVGIMLISLGSTGLVPHEAMAQQTTAAIAGKMNDTEGKPAPDVEVVARNSETGAYQIAYSDGMGRYRFLALTPGRYQVIARSLNYAQVTEQNVTLVLGHTTEVDFTLTPKDIQTGAVVVVAQQPLVDTKKSDLSEVVQPEQIRDLPLNSRNFLELAEVAPGAKGSTGGRGPVTTGAENSRFMTAYIDGGDFKNDDLGGVLGTSFGFTTNIVPEDAIQEFQVITSMYKAEFSKASNGIINAITKEGTNEFHGSTFGLFRTDGLNSRGPFETVTNPLTGRAKPDFNRQQYGFSLGGPIVMDKTHFFLSFERDNINNFNTVYTSGKQPALDGTFKNPTDENLFLAKLSQEFSSNNSLDVRWLDVSTDNKPGNFGNTFAYSNGFNLSFRLSSLLAYDRWILGPNTINELRLHYERYRKDASPNSTDPEHQYLSSNIFTGWNANQPQSEQQDKYQIRDEIEQMIPNMAGTHALKGGITLTRERFFSEAAFFSGGRFVFRTDTSALPVQGLVGFGDPTTESWNTAFGAYVQDDWTPISQLTFNLGLRWDFETNMYNNNGYTNPFAGDTALTNHIPAAYASTGDRKVDYGQVQPRVGFAWNVFDDNSTVIHGGAGIFYDRIIWNLPSNELQNGKYSIYSVSFVAHPELVTTNAAQLATDVKNGLVGTPAPALTLFPSSLPTAHTNQYSIGFSHQISSDMAASVDYVHIRGFNEYTSYNVNYQKGVGGPRVATPQFGGLALITATGSSWYDGIQFGVNRPYRGDWQLQVSYTLSWAFNTFDDPFQGYVFQSSILRAPSLQDERHRLVTSGIVNLPLGFQASGIVTLASPRPIGPTSATTGRDDNNDGVTTDDFPASGRNSIRPNPGKLRNWTRDVDLRITKYFDIPSSPVRLALIAEAFNAFNWTNYTSYVSLQRLGSLFGTPNAASNPRQVQLGLRASF